MKKTAEQRAEIIELHHQGVRQTEISKTTETPRSTVWSILRRAGVTSPRPTAPQMAQDEPVDVPGYGDVQSGGMERTDDLGGESA